MPFYNLFKRVAGLPYFLKKFIAWFLMKFTAEKRLAKQLRALINVDYEGINKLHQRFDAWRVMFDNKWRAKGIDALVAPC